MNLKNSYSSLSVVLPSYNECKAIKSVLKELDGVLSTLPLKCEIIVVDDGSTDNTSESALSAVLVAQLKVIRFSRNFGKEAAMTAGLEAASGDAVVIMDSDGQHSPAYITEFVKHWFEGYDIIYTKRASRKTDGWLRRTLSKCYYRIAFRATAFIEPEAGDFRLMSAPVVRAILSLREKNRFMKGLFNWVGFKKLAISYTPRTRIADETKFRSSRQLFRFGLLGMLSFSSLPLRMISRLGFLVAGFSVVYGVYVIVDTLVFGIDIPGWATLVVALSLLSGIQLIAIGLLGEYISLIFDEVKNRPLYVVEKITQKSGAGKEEAQS